MKKCPFLIERNKKVYPKVCQECGIGIMGKLGTKYCLKCRIKIHKAIKKKSDQKYFKSKRGKTTHNKANKTYRKTFKGKFRGKFLRVKHNERKHNLKSNFSYEEWFLKLYKHHGFCPNCDRWFGIKGLTTDHILPLSKAPEDFIYTIDDIQFLCLQCNDEKFNHIEWYPGIAHLT
jgi:5-methylcytosine-specific restriction endonuclease McrA